MHTPTSLALLLPLALVSLLACPSGPSEDEDEAGTETADESADETPSTDTGECTPEGAYGDCVQGDLSGCGASGQPALCLADNLESPSVGVCTRRCDDVCDCWAAPGSGDAELACVALVEGDPKKSCVLDCSSGQTCPDGMACLETLQICVWPKG